MKTISKFLPVFNSTSAMHRVFGDAQQNSEISAQDNVLSAILLTRKSPNGEVTVRTRTWFWKPSYAPKGTITIRFECYYNGLLVDYSCDRKLIMKTVHWLSEKGQIHKAA